MSNGSCKNIERTCVGCRKKIARTEMVRVFRLNSGEVRVAIDDDAIIGRGCYLCLSVKCLERALKNKKKNAFEHALNVKVGEELIDQLRRSIGNQ